MPSVQRHDDMWVIVDAEGNPTFQGTLRECESRLDQLENLERERQRRHPVSDELRVPWYRWLLPGLLTPFRARHAQQRSPHPAPASPQPLAPQQQPKGPNTSTTTASDDEPSEK